jgi:hypothetical protein
MRGDPPLGLLRNGKQGFKVVKIEGCAIAPGGGLILEAILPDLRFDVAVSQRVSRFFC